MDSAIVGTSSSRCTITTSAMTIVPVCLPSLQQVRHKTTANVCRHIAVKHSAHQQHAQKLQHEQTLVDAQRNRSVAKQQGRVDTLVDNIIS